MSSDLSIERYIVDDSTLVAGLGGSGSEPDRREFSRFLHDALDGGPQLVIPALCLAQAAVVRPPMASHLADLIAVGPGDAITVAGLARTSSLDALRAHCPGLTWPAVHAAVHAIADGHPILTAESHRYAATAVDVVTL